MALTYEPIATTTLSSLQSTVTFNSITGTYTDLVLVFSGTNNADDTLVFRYNNDSGTNYSDTYMYGDGLAGSGRHTSANRLFGGGVSNGGRCFQKIEIANYANSTTWKTMTLRSNRNSTTASTSTVAFVGTWRSTAAITRIDLFNHGGTDFAANSIFTLYGIKAA